MGSQVYIYPIKYVNTRPYKEPEFPTFNGQVYNEMFRSENYLNRKVGRIHLQKALKCRASSTKNTLSTKKGEIDPPPRKTFTCYECHKVYSCQRKLQQHVKLRHPNSGGTDNDSNKIIENVPRHSRQPRIFRPPRRQTSRPPTPRSITCPECNYVCYHQSDLQEHMKLMHPNFNKRSAGKNSKIYKPSVSALKIKYICPSCCKVYWDEPTLFAHRKTPHRTISSDLCQ